MNLDDEFASPSAPLMRVERDLKDDVGASQCAELQALIDQCYSAALSLTADMREHELAQSSLTAARTFSEQLTHRLADALPLSSDAEAGAPSDDAILAFGENALALNRATESPDPTLTLSLSAHVCTTVAVSRPHSADPASLRGGVDTIWKDTLISPIASFISNDYWELSDAVAVNIANSGTATAPVFKLRWTPFAQLTPTAFNLIRVTRTASEDALLIEAPFSHATVVGVRSNVRQLVGADCSSPAAFVGYTITDGAVHAVFRVRISGSVGAWALTSSVDPATVPASGFPAITKRLTDALPATLVVRVRRQEIGAYTHGVPTFARRYGKSKAVRVSKAWRSALVGYPFVRGAYPDLKIEMLASQLYALLQRAETATEEP